MAQVDYALCPRLVPLVILPAASAAPPSRWIPPRPHDNRDAQEDDGEEREANEEESEENVLVVEFGGVTEVCDAEEVDVIDGHQGRQSPGTYQSAKS